MDSDNGGKVSITGGGACGIWSSHSSSVGKNPDSKVSGRGPESEEKNCDKNKGWEMKRGKVLSHQSQTYTSRRKTSSLFYRSAGLKINPKILFLIS